MKIKFIFLLKLVAIFSVVIYVFMIYNLKNKDIIKSEILNGSGLGKAEKAFFRAEFEFMKLRDPRTNSIPANARQRELEFASSLPTRVSINKKTGNSIQSQNWVSMGPRNVGGRMLDIEFDINDENIILAGSASGGIWKSINKGMNWVRTNTPDDIQGVTCIEQDTRQGKSNIWYYGTGELLSTTDRRITHYIRTIGLGKGIYKSYDNGSTWQLLPVTKSASNGILSEVFQGIWNIEVDINRVNEDILYAACYGAIMRSTDGGESWVKVLGDLDNKSFSSDIVLSENGIIYASLSSLTTSGIRSAQTGIWKSSDGISWTEISPSNFPQDTRVIRLALAPSNQNILYVVTEVPQYSRSVQAFYPSYHSFWKYTYNPVNGQGTWENRTSNLPGEGNDNYDDNSLNTLGGYALVIKVKPDNENVVFLGGTSLFRTTNGFRDNITNINIGGYPYYFTAKELHPDMHGLAFLPSNPNVLFVANDGGVQLANNCMDSEVKWNYLTEGLITSQFYSISIDHKGFHDGMFFGGLQDNASQVLNSDDPYKPWKTVYGGDGMSSAIVDNGDFLIGSIYFASIFTTDIEGNNYINQTPIYVKELPLLFYTYFTLDLDNSKTLYLAAGNQIWRKNDIYISVLDSSRVNEGWEEITQSGDFQSSFVTALKANAARIYYGTNDGKVYRLDNPRTNSNSPFEITGNEFPGNGFVSSLDIDPDNPDKLIVVFSNYNVKSIFYTNDGGISWTHQGGNLEDDPDAGTLGPSVRFIKILRYKGSAIYFAGTSTGLYSTTQLAGNNTIWVQEGSDIIGNVIIESIDSRSTDGLVAVASQGAGVFTAYYNISGNENQNNKYDFILSQNYPNPFSNYSEIKFELEKGAYTELKIYDINGYLIKRLIREYLPEGIHNLKISADTLKPGAYFYTLISGNKKLTKKMIVLQ